MRVAVFFVLATAFSTGCSSFFNASVEGPKPGYRYVVGSHNAMASKATVWLCPDGQSNVAECEPVEVEEK
jgi:hypothetical protein